MNTSSIISPSAQLKPIVRWLALAIWILVALVFLVLFLADLITNFYRMLVPCTGALGFVGEACYFAAISPAEVAVLSSWGLTMQAYAVANAIGSVVVLLVYWALGGLILWRQGSSWLGLTVSLALIILPVSVISGSADWAAINPILFIPGVSASILGTVVVEIFLYLMPNGRFSPRWAYIPLIFSLLLVIVLTLEVNGIITLAEQTLSFIYITTISGILLSIGFQVYRYLRDSSALERQQTKWILFAVVMYLLSILVWVLIYGGALTIPAGTPRLMANLFGLLFINFFALLILPVAITIAILRYRLWDIDLIIRKTVVYAVLTGLLLLVYGGMIVLLQSIFDVVSDQQSPVVIVISTLVIAALFAPLRRRVQALIDRRFFRKKYDAQQVLAQFAQTARDETDMQILQADLLRVVQETMQPDVASLWLKEPRR